MREPQGMPGIHWVFGAQERGAQKEPRLPAGAWALFFAIRGPSECGVFPRLHGDGGEAGQAVDGWGFQGPVRPWPRSRARFP